MWSLPLTSVVVAANPAAEAGGNALQLGAPYPNPSRGGAAAVRFVVPRRSEVQVDVFDVTGRRVRTLGSETLDEGTHTASWDGRDDHGAQAAAGVYLIRARSAGVEQVRKLTVIR